MSGMNGCPPPPQTVFPLACQGWSQVTKRIGTALFKRMDIGALEEFFEAIDVNKGCSIVAHVIDR